MDDDTFNIERQYEPAPGRWRAGDSMDGDNRKIRVHLWHDTVSRWFNRIVAGGTDTMGTVHIVGDELVALAAALRLAQMRHKVTIISSSPRWLESAERPLAPELGATLQIPPHGETCSPSQAGQWKLNW